MGSGDGMVKCAESSIKCVGFAKRRTTMRRISIAFFSIIVWDCVSGRGASAAATMTQVTNDLWDVSRGTVITANSPSGAPPIAGILGFATGSQLQQDSYFADGKPAGFAHFIEFKTVNPVTIRSLSVWGGDDRNGGVPQARSFNEFKLYGWNGSAFQLLLDKPITL